MISVENLKMAFGETTVLDDISLKVEPGAIVAIMGSSGGGKTTLLRCISGLLTPTSGKVMVDGVNVEAQPEEARRHMGLVFQSAALFDYMSVLENVQFGLRRWSRESKEAQDKLAMESLKMVGLAGSEKLMPNELSGGMRKRLGLARALVLRPKVMLYDEPTTGLDPVTTYTIDQLIVQVRNRLGMTSLLVSHDVSSVFRVADLVAFLDHGKLVYVGDVKGLANSSIPAIEEIIKKAQSTSFL